MLHPILDSLLDELRERYADIPDLVIGPHHMFRDTVLHLESTSGGSPYRRW
jgi:hypothetical protein